MEPAIAGLTPSVSASAQNTISGPNSASAQRAAATSFGIAQPFSAATIALIASGRQQSPM